MGYAKLDDRLPHHRKVREISPKLALAAYGLYVASVQFAQRDETDGKISDADLLVIMPTAPRAQLRRLAEELVRVRLWDARPSGWLIHDYLDHNLSAEERQEQRRGSSTRVARYRDRLKRTGSVTRNSPDAVTRDDTRDSRVTNRDYSSPTPTTTPTTGTTALQPEGSRPPKSDQDGLEELHAQEAEASRVAFQKLVAGVSERIGFKLDAP